jgi:glucose 1-dehydrogenase
MSSDVKIDVYNDDLRVDLSGRTAIVTGAATGIGSAIAARFARSGAYVLVDYPDEKTHADAQDVIEAIRRDGGSADLIEADVAAEAGAHQLIGAAVERSGHLDILVNNAGIEENHPVVEMPLEVWERIIRVNLTGGFLCARAAARAMIAGGRGGRIINVSSVHEDLAMPNNAAYCASKGGMRMFMRTLALELAPHGITVNDIAPGAIATKINRDVRRNPSQREKLLDEIPLHRVGDADEVAALAAYLASAAAAYVTAATYVIDGGLLQYTKGL